MGYRQLLARLLPGLLAIVLGSASAAAEIRQIRVVDPRNGEPVPGVAVMMRFTTSTHGTVDHETETDKDGHFTVRRPDDALAKDDVVALYKFGYLAWSNFARLRIPIGKPLRDAPFNLIDSRDETEVPEEIILAPFPQNGWRPAHVTVLMMLIEADGRRAARPKFWKAIQREIEAARQQCGRECQ